MTCQECRTYNFDTARFCQACGHSLGTPPPPKPSPAPHYSLKIPVLIVLALMILATISEGLRHASPPVVRANGTPKADGPATLPAVEKRRPNLELLDHKSEDRAIVGHIRNNTDQTYRYVQVTFNLYDHDKTTLVGTTMANIAGPEPGATWKFTAHIFNQDAHYSSFKEISYR